MIPIILSTVTASPALLHCLMYNKNDCRDFQLVKVPSDGIEKTMIVGNSTNVPEGLKDFHGLWYMNGNEMPDEVMSFGATTLNADEEAWSMKVYDERVWSFSPDLKGRALFHAARHNGFTYKITKHNESTYQFQPQYNLPAVLFSAQIPVSQYIAKFMLIRTEDPDIWFSTGSWFSTKGASYKLTRIVDGQGEKTIKYSTDYLPNVGNSQDKKNVELKQKLLIAVVKGSTAVQSILSNEAIFAMETQATSSTANLPVAASTQGVRDSFAAHNVTDSHVDGPDIDPPE